MTLYDDWIMTFYNLIITALPPLFVACFDKDISEETIRKNPKALIEVQKGCYFNKRTIFAWLLAAFWHSMVVFLIGVGVFWPNNLVSFHGRDGGLKLLQNTVQTSAVLIPLCKFSLEMVSWNGFIFFGIYGSTAVYFVLLAIENTFYVSVPEQYGIFAMMFETTSFYFMVFLSIVVALFPDFSIKYYKRSYFPDNWQILEEQDIKRNSGDEEVLYQFSEVKEEIKEVQITTHVPSRDLNSEDD